MGEQAVREPVVYDFGVSSRLSREAVLGMRKIHAAAADELEFALSRAFGTEIKATSVEVSQVRYEAFVAMASLRLARILDERGQIDEAVGFYQRVVDLWSGAEPELRRWVDEGQARLRDLAS